MIAPSIFAPHAVLDDETRGRGLRLLTREVVFSTLADSLMSGVILTAFALHVGASNQVIGALAAVVFWGQLLQGAAAVLIEKLRMRKPIAVAGSLVLALVAALMSALAFFAVTGGAPFVLVAFVAFYAAAGAFAGCAWNGWVRDIVPGERRGRFFGRRSSLSKAVALTTGLLAAWALDQVPEGTSGRSAAFAGLFAIACAGQLLSATWLARTPEPMMPPPTEAPQRLIPMLRRVWADAKFRRWIRFLASWQFAINLAQPFVTVFYLRQLGLPMELVMALSFVTQFANMLTLGRWGQLADRLKDKSVLNIAAPTLILCIAGLVFASEIESRALLGVYLVALHLVAGTASAGVTLASGNMIMKISPRGGSEAYFAANALISSMAAGLAPLLGGFGADFFATREFAIVLEWAGPHYRGDFVRFSIHAWDFYFLLSALAGLYALHRLAMVREEGELIGRQMLKEIHAQGQQRRRRFLAGFGFQADDISPASGPD